MRSINFTAEDLYIDGTARFAGPDELTFALLKKDDRSEKPHILYRLGLYYLHGYGCTKDIGMALSYFTLASNRGCGSASYCLYRMYEKQLSFEIALQHLHKAATQGHRFAHYLMEKGLQHAD